MPRSFLVKTAKSESGKSGKTSYQKLRDVYSETAAESIKAVAPYTPTIVYSKQKYDFPEEYSRKAVKETRQPQTTIQNDAESNQQEGYATEPTVGLQSQSPDISMQPRGLSETFSPRHYPIKKRPRDICYDDTTPSPIELPPSPKRPREDLTVITSHRELCHNALTLPRDEYVIKSPHCDEEMRRSRDYIDDVIMRSRDFTEDIRLLNNAGYSEPLQNTPPTYSLAELNNRHYLSRISIYDTTNIDDDSNKFCRDYNSNIVTSHSPIFRESHDNVESDASFTKRNTGTVDYTLEAFLVSDGRSKGKSGCDSKEKQRYTCNECGKHYATSSNLSRHKQTHRSLESKMAKKCPHCDKVYVSMPALSMHVLTHELRHTCHVCNKAFSRPWLLQGHLRSHTGERPYGCAHCGKAFADRSNLRAHMQTHSSLKSFACERCNKTFALKSYLNKHYESACIKDERDIEHEMQASGQYTDVSNDYLQSSGRPTPIPLQYGIISVN